MQRRRQVGRPPGPALGLALLLLASCFCWAYCALPLPRPSLLARQGERCTQVAKVDKAARQQQQGRQPWRLQDLRLDLPISRDAKMAIAGAMAGAISTITLHPIDTAKTLRQANPHAFKGTAAALSHLLRTHGPGSVYAGVSAAVIGSMPSSALYFGAYESVKSRLTKVVGTRFGGYKGGGVGAAKGAAGGGSAALTPGWRAVVHVVAAACGNAASSLVFVPKEFVKQSLQAQKGAAMRGQATLSATALVRLTLRQQGLRGLYRGYWATLSRNVPSAVLRFTLYEELKLHMRPAAGAAAAAAGKVSPRFLVAGAVAGAIASGLTTPFDVVKTQVATGRLDRNLGVMRSLAKLGREGGLKGLYVGAQPRMVLSSLFTAVGFGSFEAMKVLLGVDRDEVPP